MKKSKSKTPLAILGLRALKEAVREAIEDHARTGDKVAIYRNGKTVMVSARSLLKYKRRRK